MFSFFFELIGLIAGKTTKKREKTNLKLFFRKWKLEVREGNYAVKSLCQKMGFTECGTRMMFCERKL
jgi:ribosomal protein S18 acetylase RimI-like enzyme